MQRLPKKTGLPKEIGLWLVGCRSNLVVGQDAVRVGCSAKTK